VTLFFILFYKLGDQMATNMSMPFYLQLGFSKTEIAAITKIYGLGATLLGGFLGGVIILKKGLKPSLWAFGWFQMLSTSGFAFLDYWGKNNSVLATVIGLENLASGMGTSAFVAFMATLTDKRYTATQYALLTSFMALPMSILSAPTGFMAEQMGWFGFFIFCTVVAIPGLVLMKIMFKSDN
jgi:PAT family beta-lactamase induction signal transducer AmpG